MKTAVITGITGQDGAYLSEYLLNQGYFVLGCYRGSASRNFWRLKALKIESHPNLKLVELDLTDLSSCISVISAYEVDELYNLAAHSFIGTSFLQPALTINVNSLGVLNLLEAIRMVKKDIRFYQASTSEMFGKAQQTPQNEETDFYPRSPYGVSKLNAHWLTINYRETYGIFASSGILFNHESPLRGEEFVTRKISKTVANIKAGKAIHLELGNLGAKRDWGYAKDYVVGMHSMLQASKPGSYVLATGRAATVRTFVELAFACIGIELTWEGEGLNEIGRDSSNNKLLVKVNPEFYRPNEVNILVGDAGKVFAELGWCSNTSLEELCSKMISADLDNIKYGR